MVILLVAYDLHNPGRNYDAIASVLEVADSYVHPEGSVWLLDTLEKPATWRDALKEAGDANDEFFVVELQKHWASSKFDKEAVTWLKSSDRRWA